MIFEILIFVAIGGIIVIVGRKLPSIMNSDESSLARPSYNHSHKPLREAQRPIFKLPDKQPEVIVQGVEKKDIVVSPTPPQAGGASGWARYQKMSAPPTSTIQSPLNPPTSSQDSQADINEKKKEIMPSEDNGQLDELLQSIDFINETNGDDFWEEPTFFSQEEVEKINQVKSLKFSTKVKDVGDYDDTVKQSNKIEAQKEEKKATEEKVEEKIKDDSDNLIPKRVLPKTPIGIGLSTNLTIRDILVQANKSFLAKNYLKAEEFYIKAASQDPNNPRIYSRLGIIYLKQGKYSDARESLAYSISLDDSSSTQFFNLAVACLHLGEQKDAVNHIKKAISIEPSNQKYQEILNQIS